MKKSKSVGKGYKRKGIWIISNIEYYSLGQKGFLLLSFLKFSYFDYVRIELLMGESMGIFFFKDLKKKVYKFEGSSDGINSSSCTFT